MCYPRGGGTDQERGMGMCRGHDPLFSGQSALPSLPIYHQCAPYFQLLEKKCIFSLVFQPKFQLSRGKISEFSLPRPLIFQRKPAPLTLLLETRVAQTHQKKLSAPPRGVTFFVFTLIYISFFYVSVMYNEAYNLDDIKKTCVEHDDLFIIYFTFKLMFVLYF